MIKWWRILINPYFFAFLVSLLVYWGLPQQEHPLRTEIVDYHDRSGVNVVFADLNSDSISEMLILGDYKTNPYIEVFDLDNRHIALWSLSGEWCRGRRLILGDYNRNGHLEAYTFIEKNDSIFICGNEVLFAEGLSIREFFLFPMPIHNGNADYTIVTGEVKDINGDGYGDVVFGFTAGYSLQPRGIYAFDIHNQNVISTPFMGAYVRNIDFADLDHDGFQELWVETLATCNYSPDSLITCSDQASWLMALGENLEFEFDPIPYYGQTNKFYFSVLDQKRGQMLAVLRTTNQNLPEKNIFVLDAAGKVLFSEHLDGWDDKVYPLVLKGEEGNRSFVYSIPQQEVFELTNTYQLIKKEGVPPFVTPFILIDVNADGQEECVTLGKHGDIIILDPDFKILGKLPLIPVQSGAVIEAMPVYKNPVEKLTAILLQEHQYLVSIAQNPWYSLRFLKLIPIYLLLMTVVWISLKLQALRKKQAERITAEIQRWQLRFTLAQLDPHFTFNALNAIGSVIKQEDPDKAYNYMIRFTKLIRSLLENADKIAWSLEEELRFVDHYLKLQQLRFRDHFDYEINIDETIDLRIEVPKMLVQHYAENGVKHGLRPMKDVGKLGVDIGRAEMGIVIRIIDNGIGRKAAANNQVTDSTGKGEQLSKTLLKLYRNLTKRDINIEIKDQVSEDGEPKGTEVVIMIME